MIKHLRSQSLYIGLFIALVGTVGSLYFSEIMHLTPCVLCWYQRIALYPLVFIFATGIIKKTHDAWNYALPLISIGGLIGLYQVLLVEKLVPETAGTCALGVPCSLATWNLFGFITIPFLSFVAFAFLFILYFITKRK